MLQASAACLQAPAETDASVQAARSRLARAAEDLAAFFATTGPLANCSPIAAARAADAAQAQPANNDPGDAAPFPWPKAAAQSAQAVHAKQQPLHRQAPHVWRQASGGAAWPQVYYAPVAPQAAPAHPVLIASPMAVHPHVGSVPAPWPGMPLTPGVLAPQG